MFSSAIGAQAAAAIVFARPWCRVASSMERMKLPFRQVIDSIEGRRLKAQTQTQLLRPKQQNDAAYNKRYFEQKTNLKS